MKKILILTTFLVSCFIGFAMLAAEECETCREKGKETSLDQESDSELRKYYFQRYIPSRYRRYYYNPGQHLKMLEPDKKRYFYLLEDKDFLEDKNPTNYVPEKDFNLIVPSKIFAKQSLSYGQSGESLDYGFDGIGGSTGALSRFDYISGFDASYSEE